MSDTVSHDEETRARKQETLELTRSTIVSVLVALVLGVAALAMFPQMFQPRSPGWPDHASWNAGLDFWAATSSGATSWLAPMAAAAFVLYVPLIGQSISRPPAGFAERTRVRFASAGSLMASGAGAYLLVMVVVAAARPKTGPQLIGIAVLCALTFVVGVSVGAFATGSTEYRLELRESQLSRLTWWRGRLLDRSGQEPRRISLGIALIAQMAWAFAPLGIGEASRALSGLFPRDSFASIALSGASVILILSVMASVGAAIAAILYTSDIGGGGLTVACSIVVVALTWLFPLAYCVTWLISGKQPEIIAGIVMLLLLTGLAACWVTPMARRRPSAVWLPGSAAIRTGLALTTWPLKQTQQMVAALDGEIRASRPRNHEFPTSLMHCRSDPRE